MRVRGVLALLLLGACGGGTQASVRSSDDAIGAESSEDDPSSPDVSTATPEERVEAVCADETCVPCGEAFCPTGYYCDESSEPPICSWLPDCATDASCECLERTLGSGCRCESRDGGAFVTCS